MKASLLYRTAGVLLLIFAVGHTLGFRQSDPSWGIETLLGSSDKAAWSLFYARVLRPFGNATRVGNHGFDSNFPLSSSYAHLSEGVLPPTTSRSVWITPWRQSFSH
jgi:hypothetical protein